MTSREVKLRSPMGYETVSALIIDDHLGVAYVRENYRVEAHTRRIIAKAPAGFCVILLADGVLLSSPVPTLYEAACYANSLARVCDWSTWRDDPSGTHERVVAWRDLWTARGGWLGADGIVGTTAERTLHRSA